LPISEAEVFALLAARKAIAQHHDTPFDIEFTQSWIDTYRALF
jgi:hypothetical protein